MPARAGSPPADPPAGFVALFNGRDLAGWYGLPQIDPAKLAAMSADERAQKRAADAVEFTKHWSVENGELVNDGNGPFATTDRDYGDIDLRLEYRTVAKADSGIYLRGTPQVQIWDTTEAGGKWKQGADKGSGALWNNSPGAAGKDPLKLADKPFGEWNSLRIVQAGERTWVWLNGTLTVDGARMENFWDRTAPLPQGGPDSVADARRRDPLAQRVPARAPRGGGDQADLRRVARRASPRSSTARTGPDGRGPSRTTRSSTAPSGASRRAAGQSTQSRSTAISSCVSNSSCRRPATTAWRFGIPERATPRTWG